MHFDIQPSLENKNIRLEPLKNGDFDRIYNVASDPKIWEQHPNKNRWQKDVFLNFFDGALKSNGAFLIVDKTSDEVIGSTRFYDYNENDSSILIGYTFYSTSCWGKGINYAVKSLMLDYIFQYVDRVEFHIGAENIRSQKAIDKLGVTKIGEQEVTYFGEESKLNCIYSITKNEWLKHHN